MDPSDTQKPKRRARYSGSHPKKFTEKYKELNPERYSEDLKKVIDRGGTPAGTHRAICLKEIVEILNPKAGETALDATLGYGGHAQALLERLQPGGRLIALDQDPIERPKTEARLRSLGYLEPALLVGAINFSETKSYFRQLGIGRVNMVLADLGLSSMQIDNPERGFTFKQEGPFDLRMNPKKGESAAQLMKRLSEEEIRTLLVENSDEPHARQIAAALFKAKPQTTSAVYRTVQNVTKSFSPNVQEKEGDTPVRRVFQSFRISVNNEFSTLERFLTDIPDFLAPRGRVAILSFHSGEDRRVKKYFQAGLRAGIYREISPDIIRPTPEEQESNPRSRSAKLRWART